MGRLALVAMCLALTGCGEREIYVDKRFSNSEDRAIRKGAYLWTKAGENINLVFNEPVSYTRDRIIRAQIGEHDEMVHFCEFDAGAIACTGRKDLLMGDTIVIWPARIPGYPHDLFKIAAHEIGHVIGLRHLDEPTAIMHGELSEETADDLTPADLNALRLHWICEKEPRGCER